MIHRSSPIASPDGADDDLTGTDLKEQFYSYLQAFADDRGASVSHGLDRCRYKGIEGMKRWVGLGVIADNLIIIAHSLDATAAFCAGK